MAHGHAKFERLVATPCLRSRGRGRDWRFFGKKALTEDRAGEEDACRGRTTTYFSEGFPALVTSVAVPKLPLPRTLTRRYRSMMAAVRFSRTSRQRDSSASGSRGADEAIDARQISVVRARKSPECRARSTGGPVRRTERTSGGCADGCASSGSETARIIMLTFLVLSSAREYFRGSADTWKIKIFRLFTHWSLLKTENFLAFGDKGRVGEGAFGNRARF